jgi:hypothetical protein
MSGVRVVSPHYKWEENDMNRGANETNLRENRTTSQSDQINLCDAVIIRILFIHTPHVSSKNN